MNAVNSLVRDQQEARAQAAVEAANKWVDAARPMFMAFFKLDDINDDLRWCRAITDQNDYDERVGREAASYVWKAAKALREIITGIRDDFIADQSYKHPAQCATEEEWEERDRLADFIGEETISVDQAEKQMEREWNAREAGK